MSKIVDITDKLQFEENPKLVIKDKELEVNADAATVLKIMGILGDGENVQITDKLQFEENPKLVIKDKELEVNADAATVLKIMGILGDGENVQPSDVVKMYELIFSEADRKKIDKMKLQFADFQTLVFSSISLITGEEESGE